MISGHGDDSFRLNTHVKADFSSNVWFGGPSPELIQHLQQNIHQIGNYPEPDAAGLCLRIADYHWVKPAQVLAFNGSVEAFYTIALAFRAKHSAILSPAFAEYEDACRMHEHYVSFFTFEEKLQAADLCWIGNPNNPDGHIFNRTEIESFLIAHPETVLVVDEAYSTFVPEFHSVIELTARFENLIVVRSLTKCCAIPGVRLGYTIASQKLAARLRKFQQPWSVNGLAQLAGKFLIENDIPNRLDSTEIMKLSQHLQESIDQLAGFRVVRSQAPFFLVEMQTGTAADLKEFLINQYGILIRDASNFRGLNEQFFRVCTRSEAENSLLQKGLNEYLIS
jgi:Histidinol-phosphate/aromatic aminotransferase and cobyric acid decarboxylase